MRATNLFRSHLNMIMFRGKLTVSPNTLNNEIHTYFFAHRWQQKFITKKIYDDNQIAKKAMERLKNMQNLDSTELIPTSPADYTYESWIKLIKNVSEFNRFYVECYKEAFPDLGKNINIMDFRAFRLFHDWDVWGDSTSYPQLKATAVLDTSKEDPIQLLEDDLHLTTKMGTNKCVIANMDTDSQDMSKLFAFTLSINQQLKLHLNPSVSRTLYFRTVDTLPWTTSMGVHWFASGKTQLLHGNVDHTEVKWPLNLLYKRVFEDQKRAQEEKSLTEMRMLQYRYNHPTKVSSVVGYLMNTQGNEHEYINHNWRIVKVTSNEYSNPNPDRNYNGSTNNKTSAEVFLRNIEFGASSKGVLVDVSATVMDANNNDLLPVFPDTFTIKIFIKEELIGQYSSKDKEEIKKLFHNQAGLLVIKNTTLPEGVPIRIQLNQTLQSTIIPRTQLDKITIDFKGEEQSFNLEIKDHFLKTQRLPVSVKKDKVGSNPTIFQIYDNFVRYELNCTQYGKPFSGKLKLKLASKFNIDPSGLTQYTKKCCYLKTIKKQGDPTTDIQPPQKRITGLIDASAKFKSKYKSFQEVNLQVFHGKLDEIITMTDQFIKDLFNNNQLQYCFKENGISKPFKLSFQANRDVTDYQVLFKDGVADVQVYLNNDLVQSNNPRNPAMESLCLIGQIKICQEKKENNKDKLEAEEKINPNITALFFQNPQKDPFYRIDWQHAVGPKLRLMGLMYPSMQNIVNLYNYDGLSMSAMRRAFSVQDEKHSRYMPATREMSPSTHRQIRRWLYNPVFDSQITVGERNSLDTRIMNLSIVDFDADKTKLIEMLKSAFKIELVTIPLYLSALFSITRQGEATKLIRSVAKDEMKHLFIVSNILNALGEAPPYPKPTSMSTSTSNQAQDENIPVFPIKAQTDIICFHFQKKENQEWKDLMNPLPIQSSIREQLLRFIMIEMPGQAYSIQINFKLVDDNQNKAHQTKSFVDITKPTCKCDTIFCKCGVVRNTLFERTYRIQLLQRAINAVVKELKQQQDHSESASQFMTIGMAYQKITDYLWALNDQNPVKLFSGDNAKQFTYMYLDNMTEVINLRTALEQIRLITQQGQGSSIFTVTGETNKSSHFIKFIEIFTGCDLHIISQFPEASIESKNNYMKREANFVLTPNSWRFPNFPNYTTVQWDAKTDQCVDGLVDSQLALERLSDRLEKTQFPNTYAPRSFLNNYAKILEELGFIFTTDPKKFKSSDGLTFEETRLRSLENSVARMRQMTLNSTHIVNPNDTFDQQSCNPNQTYYNYPMPKTNPSEKYPSASPKFNLKDSKWLPNPKDQPDKK